MWRCKNRHEKRSDLDVIEEMLNNGATPEEIFEISFCYRKYEKMIKADYLARRIKETPLVKDMWNEYHWGRSGSGKTYTYIKLCEKYPDEVYLCNDYANSGASGGGFDFYSSNPAKIVILDEFRGNLPYAQLLSLLDVYSSNQQHCRYQNVYNLWKELKKAHNFEIDKRRALTVAEQEIFEAFLSENKQYHRWYPIFVIMLWTGMRVGEITGLRWCDIDFEDETISVNHTLVYYSTRTEQGQIFAINTPKTKAGERIIPMFPKVKEAFLMEKAY